MPPFQILADFDPRRIGLRVGILAMDSALVNAGHFFESLVGRIFYDTFCVFYDAASAWVTEVTA